MNRPILFNTEMVQAILDGRKTVTRRVVKMDRHSIYKAACAAGRWSETFGGEIPDEVAEWYVKEVAKPPYHPGDILWVRETWSPVWVHPIRYLYKCFCPEAEGLPVRWHPSIHMPKAAARLFLRVTAVRVERLQEISPDQCAKEGLTVTQKSVLNEEEYWYWFMNLWNSTIKPADLPRYGWDANPWVWVVEFERCEKPEGWAVKYDGTV